jgi:alpha-galactosidase
LTWKDGEVMAGNSLIRRRWQLVDGLPVPISLVAYGREWLKPDGKPGTVPAGNSLQPPLNVHWNTDLGPADPVEAPSLRGALTVVGRDGCGYRWHLQVFADCPAITCRMERLGAGDIPSPVTESAYSESAVATGIERDAEQRQETSDRDLMERLPLASMHAQLAVVELVDVTDNHDNLAQERVWQLGPKEAIKAATCLAAINDPLADAGLILLKHAPLPGVRPVKTPVDVIGEDRLVRLLGHGADSEGQGYAWSVIAWAGGRWERAAALHRLQQCFRPFRPGRDGLLLSNTWGDRNRDSRIAESFILAEIIAGAALGVDICQVDDGWEKGVTSNSAQPEKGVWNGFWAADPDFWTANPERFPHGLDSVVDAAKAKGLALGLWFAPDSSNHFANWEKDAAVVIDLYRRHGVRFIKVDGVKTTTKAGELNLQRFFARVRRETQGELTIDLDVTAEVRPGYFGAMQVGPIFLENRYTDWGQWWPHSTLRNLWELSWHVPPQRLRIEFLNPQRNQDKYGGSPLAPAQYPADYPFATTLVANPLAWLEVSNLPEDVAKPIAALAAIWRKHRDELHAGITLPIGDSPTGAAWTGFCSRGQNTAHVLVFRELTRHPERDLELPIPPGNWSVEPIAGTGDAIWRDGRLHVTIPKPLHWLWVRFQR